MYSVVMMMAMTGAPEMPAFGFRRNGCDGGCAGYNAGCAGGRGGRGCRGDDGGCWGGGGKRARKRGGNGCCGYNAGCGCNGYAQANCGCFGQMAAVSGCGGCGGAVGVPMGVPAQTPAPPAMPPKDAGTPASTMAAPATIVVSLPADANLKIDGTATTQTSGTRHFTTPTLAAGQTFVYTLTAEVVRNGETLSSVQKITVRAGEQTNVSLPVEQFATTLAMR
jgi:uncharacterized protein (TIGR03000 family)